MNKNAKKWVAALRSGEFKQAKGKLRRDGAYCCLGVACELYRREHKRSPQWEGDEFEDSATSLDYRVMKWLGLASREGRYVQKSKLIIGYEDYIYLSADNDNGKTFEEIADIIESEPKKLFGAIKK